MNKIGSAGNTGAGVRSDCLVTLEITGQESGRNIDLRSKVSALYGDAIREFIDTIPIGRRGQPEDQANAALFLLSDESSFISGAVLFVDGGHDAMFRADRF